MFKAVYNRLPAITNCVAVPFGHHSWLNAVVEMSD